MRKIKDGAGAGYTIESYLSNFDIRSVDLLDVDAQNAVSCRCDIDCDAEIISASSYGYGGKINEIVPCTIYYVEVQLFYDSNIKDIFGVDDEKDINLSNVNQQALEDYIYDVLSEGVHTKIVYGSGWSHVEYNGKIADKDDYNDAYPSRLVAIEGIIEDRDMVSYIDRVVQGENIYTNYEIYTEGEFYLQYESEEEAIKKAKQLTKEYDSVEVRRVDYIYYLNGDFDIDYEEVVWEF